MPYFANMTLEEIDTNTIQRFVNERFDMSHSSIHHMIILLHEIFEATVEDGYMLKDPTDSKRLTLPTRKITREALTTGEYVHILRQLPQLKAPDATLVAILAYTGMRRGEALGLQWTDIDLEAGLITIQRGVTFEANQPVIGTPKSKAGYRPIPIVEALLPYLHKPQTGINVIGGGDKPITESTFDRTWQRIGKTIDLHGATSHVLRHTYLTTLGATATNVKTVQAIAGHADIQTTMNRYVHSRTESIKAVGVAFDKLTTELTQVGA